MTPEELLASLPTDYTPGPWRAAHDDVVTRDGIRVVECAFYRDVAFIAAAPALVDALRAVVAERDRLRDILTEAHEAIGVLRVRDNNDPEDFAELLGRIEVACAADKALDGGK